MRDEYELIIGDKLPTAESRAANRAAEIKAMADNARSILESLDEGARRRFATLSVPEMAKDLEVPEEILRTEQQHFPAVREKIEEVTGRKFPTKHNRYKLSDKQPWKSRVITVRQKQCLPLGAAAEFCEVSRTTIENARLYGSVWFGGKKLPTWPIPKKHALKDKRCAPLDQLEIFLNKRKAALKAGWSGFRSPLAAKSNAQPHDDEQSEPQ